MTKKRDSFTTNDGAVYSRSSRCTTEEWEEFKANVLDGFNPVTPDTISGPLNADKATVVYVSGPMTGYPEHNYPAFHRASKLLRELGYEVVNPAENFEGRLDLEPEVYLRKDFTQMATQCNALYLLEGWQNSTGARAEYAVARALGFNILNADVATINEMGLAGRVADASEPVEFEASRIVRNGERQKNYGHPNADFQRTAGMWSAILGVEVSMQDMALCMAALKISRLKSTPGHHDSLVDLIGYAICYERLGE